ncbi:MAG: hypothetical protein WD046_04155 [Paracoccaceae bacterium]
MSSCLCHISPSAVSGLVASASAMSSLTLGPAAAVVKLQMAAQAAAAAKVDIGGLAYTASALPNIQAAFGAGGLMQLAATLKVAAGTYNLMDPIKLSEQLGASAGSLARLPPATFSAVAKIDMTAIAKITATARLVAQLKLDGLDPLSASFSENVAAKAHAAAGLAAANAALTAPLRMKLQAVAALPALVQACETLNVPLGDPTAVAAAFQARLSVLAQVVPPAFPVSMKLVLKAAAIAEAMAVIAAAFGPAALSPATMAKFTASLSATLNAAAAANINIKLAPPPIPIPPMEDIILGEKVAASSFMQIRATGLTPPKIAVLPPVSAMIALRATLGLAMGAEPLALCTMCGSS